MLLFHGAGVLSFAPFSTSVFSAGHNWVFLSKVGRTFAYGGMLVVLLGLPLPGFFTSRLRGAEPQPNPPLFAHYLATPGFHLSPNVFLSWSSGSECTSAACTALTFSGCLAFLSTFVLRPGFLPTRRRIAFASGAFFFFPRMSSGGQRVYRSGRMVCTF